MAWSVERRLLVRDAMSVINRVLCLVLLVVAMSSPSHTAHADDELPRHELRHRETARWSSLGGTLTSLAVAGIGAAMLKYGRDHHPETSFSSSMRLYGSWLIGIGGASTLFTPTLGEWYAGEVITGGLKLRGVGVGIGLIGIAAYFLSGKECQQFGSTCFGGEPHDPVPATVLISIGSATYLGGMIYDIVRAPGAADRYNALHVELRPTAIWSPSGIHPGIGLSARF
jgi:hypothetical protein